MISPVANAARIVAELRERLKTTYGLCDEDEALEDTLEGASELPELLAMMARDAVQAEDYAEATGKRIDILQERYTRLMNRHKKLRDSIAWALAEAGWRKIPEDALPDMGPCTLSTPKKKKLSIDNEDEIPNQFRVPKPTAFTVDKDSLTEWLERGGVCAGARLNNAAPVLTLRSK